MKKISILLTLFLFAFFASAQNVDGGATDIMKKLSAKYSNFSTMKISYTYKCESNDKVIDTQTGTMNIKGEKYTFVFGNQTSYCNGKNLWNYQKDINEVSVFEYVEAEDNLLNPAKILKEWQKEYRAKFIREETQNGKLVQIIDLLPLQSSSYYKIRLFIDKSKLEINGISAFEKGSTVYSYHIDKFTVNTSIDDTTFVFDMKQHPGVEVNDMR